MSDKDTQTDADSQTDGTSDSGGRKRALFIVAGLFLLFAIAAGVYWFLHRNLVSTDDAFIHADIVQVAARIPGTVTKVYISDNEHVEAGQPLVKLDPTDYRVAVAQAKANLSAAKAKHASSVSQIKLIKKTSAAAISHAQAALASTQAAAANAQADLKRYQQLYAKDEIAQQRVAQARTAVKTADARVRQAQAQLAQAQAAPQKIAAKQAQAQAARAGIKQARAALKQARLNLSYTNIRAPQSGTIAKKNVLPGSKVAAAQAMMAVVSDHPWVIANFKETQLTHMQPGQPVSIEVDTYPDHTFHGHVDSIQAGTGAAFSLLPPQNASGNFVKVVQRIPVKIVFDKLPEDARFELVPGMSVVPTVNVAPDQHHETKSANGTRSGE